MEIPSKQQQQQTNPSKPTDPKQIEQFFGKKKKTPQENSACLLACVINFLKMPENKARVIKLEKYIGRCKNIALADEDQQQQILISDCQYLHVAIHNLIINAHLLGFEAKKDTYSILLSILRASNKSVQYFSLNAQPIVDYLLANFESPEMSFFAGNVLRIMLKQEFLGQILDLHLLEAIILIIKNTGFEIASEAIETFHVIFKQKKQAQKEILSNFLLNNHTQIVKLFTELTENKNYIAKRDTLQILNLILSDPSNKQFTTRFINEKENLIQIMNQLTSEDQGGYKDSALFLLDHFLQNYTLIDNQKVTSIIIRNKVQLIQCIKQCVEESDQNNENKEEIQDRKDLMIHTLEEL